LINLCGGYLLLRKDLLTLDGYVRAPLRQASRLMLQQIVRTDSFLTPSRADNGSHCYYKNNDAAAYKRIGARGFSYREEHPYGIEYRLDDCDEVRLNRGNAFDRDGK
jgi:hypothetical protein